MESPKFAIGNRVYKSCFETMKQVWIECPDCCGSGRLKVVLGTGEEVQIACECCARGYEGSPGKILIYKASAKAELVTITGLDIRDGEANKYYHSPHFVSGDDNLFFSEADAMAQANEKAEAHRINQERQIERKVRADKKWAWHVTYHRRQIKEMEKRIEYHRGALAVADKKVKV